MTEFKTALLMTEQDDLPLDESYFDLGLTSLTVNDLKQRLESLLSREIDGTLLFNSPTVQRLLDHLEEDVLADLFAGTAEPARQVAAPARDALVDDLLAELYQG
ncbi:acyl carrier protein [Micromonospora matsumotoense]|uniref:acyl carrier protein n=1 Tax=Micromonospora matsumotoense TaxID=121616 RepID=UPI001FDFDF7A|nr:acyl carrier protein [Micromonospora matsumotoense]